MKMPTSESISYQLLIDCQTFIDQTAPLSDERFNQRVDGKWSVADLMQHLYLSARPVAHLLTGSRDVFGQWGVPAGPSRSYEVLVEAYRQVLETGFKAPANRSPRPGDLDAERNTVEEQFKEIYRATADAASVWSDGDLDAYVMPHPALGMLTVREMLYFISIHTKHHLEQVPNL